MRRITILESRKQFLKTLRTSSQKPTSLYLFYNLGTFPNLYNFRSSFKIKPKLNYSLREKGFIITFSQFNCEFKMYTRSPLYSRKCITSDMPICQIYHNSIKDYNPNTYFLSSREQRLLLENLRPDLNQKSKNRFKPTDYPFK